MYSKFRNKPCEIVEQNWIFKISIDMNIEIKQYKTILLSGPNRLRKDEFFISVADIKETLKFQFVTLKTVRPAELSKN